MTAPPLPTIPNPPKEPKKEDINSHCSPNRRSSLSLPELNSKPDPREDKLGLFGPFYLPFRFPGRKQSRDSAPILQRPDATILRTTTMAVSPPKELPATSAPAAPRPVSQDINIKATPDTPQEATAPTSTANPGASSIPGTASGANAETTQDAAGSGAPGISEQLAVSMTTAVAGVAVPPAAAVASSTAQKLAAESKKEPPAQPRISTITDDVNPVDFEGAVNTNNEIPSPETLKKIENYMVLDGDGRSHSFKSLYSGSHTARRVLVIFVRHFFCGVSFLIFF